MKAAWYEKQGAARDVLIVGEMNDPQPLAGEVRIQSPFRALIPAMARNARMRLAFGKCLTACQSAQRRIGYC